MANYTTAFHEPMVSDWSNYESWSENGELTACQRANKIYRQKLKAYQPLQMNESILSVLKAYVAERRLEIQKG